MAISGDELAVLVPSMDPELLRTRARWIRDELDPIVAREGPNRMHPDDVLELDEFFRHLLVWPIPLQTVRYSRIHLAILEIAGRATCWPHRLIERCDSLIEKWEKQFGNLRKLGTPLYEAGGRLHCVAKPEDLSRERLLVKWLRQPGVHVNPAVARKHGDLGFRPGDWWISPMFAFRYGMLDSGDPNGGVVADANGAYALLMTENDEINSPTPDIFTYRAKASDKGKYRLTDGKPESRMPIRVLRGHTLRSFWTPRAGIRYDGLHKTVAWSVVRDRITGAWTYNITLQRLPDQEPMEKVLRRPWAEEIEDYREFKRLRKEVKDKQVAAKLEAKPSIKIGMDLV